jgi:hypothetical protein
MTKTSGDLSSPNFSRKQDSNLSQDTMVWGCWEKYQVEALPSNVYGKSLHTTSSCSTLQSLMASMNFLYDPQRSAWNLDRI